MTSSLEALLAEDAATFRFKPPFTAIGTPGLLATNERTPEGFYTGLRKTAELDGYLFGAGCGNVISMVGAFPRLPRGVIFADVDPAVVCAGRMFVAGLRESSDVESFARRFFANSETALVELEHQALQGSDPFDLAQQLEMHRPRLRASLRRLTEDFRHRPEDAPELVASWLNAPTDRDQPIPVRHFLARNYDKLHQLAREGRIAVVQASIFEPTLLDALSRLPGFAASRNLVYLSNAVDHMLRRALLLSARTELGLIDGEPPPVYGSIQAFVEHLNRDLMAPLRGLAGAEGNVFVHSTSGRDLRLGWQISAPELAADDFNLRFDLRKMILGFFESFVASGASSTDSEDPWDEVGARRATAFDLYLAAIVGDSARAKAALDRLDGSFRSPKAEHQSMSLAYGLAEVSHAALMARRSPLATELAEPLTALSRRIDSLLQEIPKSSANPEGFEDLIYSVAHELGGRLATAEPSGGHNPGRSQHLLQVQHNGHAGVGAELLWRSIQQQIHDPNPSSATHLGRSVAALLAAIGPHGNVDPSTSAESEEPGSDYRAFITRDDTMYDNLRLALLYAGLWLETAEPIEAALRVNFYVQQQQQRRAVPQTAALLERLKS